jgi:hypothetical protein
MKHNKFDGFNYHDHVIYCDICGIPTPFSEAKLLDTYTGRGGLLVCKRDADTIDPGLIPYKINTESIINESSINHYATNPNNVPNTYTPFDYADFDPMSFDPNDSSGIVWDKLNLQVWMLWDTPWGYPFSGPFVGVDWNLLDAGNWEDWNSVWNEG